MIIGCAVCGLIVLVKHCKAKARHLADDGEQSIVVTEGIKVAREEVDYRNDLMEKWPRTVRDAVGSH